MKNIIELMMIIDLSGYILSFRKEDNTARESIYQSLGTDKIFALSLACEPTSRFSKGMLFMMAGQYCCICYALNARHSQEAVEVLNAGCKGVLDKVLLISLVVVIDIVGTLTVLPVVVTLWKEQHHPF